VRRIWATVACCLMLATTTGCSRQSSVPTAEPPLPLAAPKGMTQVTPDQSATFMPLVNRYFYVRKQAVLAGDPEVIWREFPPLREGYNRQAGINAEADVINGYRSIAAVDGNVDPESYARLKTVVDGDQAVLLVNGTEMYLTKAFSESGGQVQVMLFLEKRSDGWTLVKTDETTIAEYKAALAK